MHDLQQLTERELEASLRFAQAHVERAISQEHVEYYSAQVISILNEYRARETIRIHNLHR